MEPYKNLAVFFLILILSGCSLEYKLARSFVEEAEKPALMFIGADYLYKTSLKEKDISQAGEMDQFALDSALYYQSRFLQNIEDERFMKTFEHAYIQELQELGFDVYREYQMDAFLLREGPSFMINMAQMEMEEYYYSLRDEEVFDGYRYYKDVDLNAVGLNCWFELSLMNSDDKKILYASNYTMDEYQGSFRYYPFTGEVSHQYEIDSLSVGNVYNFAGILGKKYAGYTFDYIMNMYIYSNLPANQEPGIFYHYNRQKNNFIPAGEDRFEPLDQ